MKSKYQVLTPIIKKINEASTERKRHEQKIKTLLKQLNEARTNLSNSHQKFSESVKDLVEKKEVLDKSVEKAVRKEAKIVPPVTSTPLRVSSSNNSVEDCTVSTITNHECEDMDVCDSDEDIMAQIDIVDPNDIYQIFTRKPIKYNVPDYVSPLNFDRYEQVDPHGIMCPYEVNGSCRDADCTFKHYLKKY